MKKKIVIFKVIYFALMITGIAIGIIIDAPIVIGLFSGMLIGGLYQLISKPSIAVIDENAIKYYLTKKEEIKGKNS